VIPIWLELLWSYWGFIAAVVFWILGVYDHNSVAIDTSEALKAPHIIGTLLGSHRSDRAISWRGIWSQLVACFFLGFGLKSVGILPMDVLGLWQDAVSVALIAVFIALIYQYWRHP
jgi:hypothetical protein